MIELFVIISSFSVQISTYVPFKYGYTIESPEMWEALVLDNSNSNFHVPVSLKVQMTVQQICGALGHDEYIEPCYAAVNPPCLGHYKCRRCKEKLNKNVTDPFRGSQSPYGIIRVPIFIPNSIYP